ncbi:hypothetical protein ABEV34_04760 [Methylorubrum rhodesianum]|uniref:hypothetical protein n=1 Tax=Methylorubrum rhodesianum TaxID=29427 RepID=UPI003D26D401
MSVIRERNEYDAPPGYNLREAETWASGFNAAAEIANELLAALEAVLPHAANGVDADRAATAALPEHLRVFFSCADAAASADLEAARAVVAKAKAL